MLLISVDGLRPVDVAAERMPALSRLADEGVRASDGMRPSYPSLTFPNHYAIVTGLRPDRNGIVHNRMRDADLGEFRVGLREAVGDGRWWQGDPVWAAAERAGLRSAVLFWPGSEAEIGGIRPSRWSLYDKDTTARQRADRVADWLLEPAATRPAFATLYFDRVDHEQHEHGPDSPEAIAALRDTDAALDHLVARLQARGALDRVNLVVVSDHGFADVAPGHLVVVEDVIAAEHALAVSLGQVVTFMPQPGHEAEAGMRLLGRHDHFECWNKAALPARWRYGRHPRVPPIVCQMDEGWDMIARSSQAERRAGGRRGSHGYDPDLPSMRAVFIARGPAFRPGTMLPPFANVDVYPLLMHLLGLPPAANDGDLTPLQPALRARSAH